MDGGGLHAFDLWDKHLWALVWERLGADTEAKRAFAATSCALHDLALALWRAVRVETTGAGAAAAAAFVGRLRWAGGRSVGRVPVLLLHV